MASEPTPLEPEGAGTHRFWDGFARTRVAAVVALCWGFAEATFFFLVPDVWIGLLTLFSWRAGLRAVCSAVMGALLGGAVMYEVGAKLDRERSVQLLAAVPAISPAMVERVEEDMREHGPVSMLLGPLRGTPYKIYARTAGAQEQPLGTVLLWTIPARGARFVLIAAVAGLYGWLVRRITTRTGWLLGPYLLVWTLFYVRYFRAYGFRRPRVLSPPPHSMSRTPARIAPLFSHGPLPPAAPPRKMPSRKRKTPLS